MLRKQAQGGCVSILSESSQEAEAVTEEEEPRRDV